jgi:hypothetical protein
MAVTKVLITALLFQIVKKAHGAPQVMAHNGTHFCSQRRVDKSERPFQAGFIDALWAPFIVAQRQLLLPVVAPNEVSMIDL